MAEALEFYQFIMSKPLRLIAFLLATFGPAVVAHKSWVAQDERQKHEPKLAQRAKRAAIALAMVIAGYWAAIYAFPGPWSYMPLF